MGFSLKTGVDAMDFSLVHSWLTTAYWSPGVTREKVEHAARGSSQVIRAFEDGQQIGYCRIVSDRTTFAWVCDVWVAESARGRGIARAMVGHAMEDEEHQDLRRWLLATKDAHGVYAALGFEPLPMPERWMVTGQTSIEATGSGRS